MGYPDRLREEGLSEDEIAEMLADGAAVERPQNPETKRVSFDTEPPAGRPADPRPGDPDYVHSGDDGFVPEGLAEPVVEESDEDDSVDDED